MGNFLDKMQSKKKPAGLSITSLMDVLTIILIFLLVNYSDEFKDVKTPKFVKLPSITALAAGDPSDHIMVAVGKNKIEINDKLIRFSSFQKQKWKVLSEAATLLDKAVKRKKKKKQRVMTIQADKDVEYVVIESLLTQASSVGITRIEFMALKMNK